MITIITVCLNADATIEETILSVISQKDETVEYIIVDGGSTDNTVNIIKKYEQKIDYWISEPDLGIYDAMNKGASFASDNSYLIWLNSDDILLEIPKINDRYDAFYYNSLINDIYSGYTMVFKSMRWKKLSYRSIFFPKFHHQGFIIKKSIFKKHKYDTSIGLLADYYLMSLVLNQYNCLFVDTYFIKFRTGGVADRSNIQKLISYLRIAKRFNLNLAIFIIVNLDRILKIFLRKYLGRRISLKIRKFTLKFFGKY